MGSRNDDPVLAQDDDCCCWYGEIAEDDLQAVCRIIKHVESSKTRCYTNRILAFMFADDHSFKQLPKAWHVPLKMSCGDPLCVRVTHMSVPDNQSAPCRQQALRKERLV